MPCTLKLGIWQDAGAIGDISGNLGIIRHAAKKAADAGIELLVFPECFLTGYYNTDTFEESAAAVTQTALDELADIAKFANIAIVTGYYETFEEQVYNSSIFIDGQGDVLNVYRKRALYGTWEETIFERGNGSKIIKFKGFNLGFLICFDIEFPELIRELSKNNADVILIPTALMAPNDAVADHLVLTRALENQVFIAYANRIGQENELTYIGKSCIVNPQGDVLARASGEKAELIVAEINLETIAKSRAKYNYLSTLDDLTALIK